ncbi:uncharacterized protein NPIL_381271 [Nephila pilipes]|uniref:Gustatory receptor n=1 Tax=Nephila pilipes TaxID=299642 RepID=A0A8X6QC42_NEPPI|nr:uncharacterized protein NPIL_381271 [Nephila pilipes]
MDRNTSLFNKKQNNLFTITNKNPSANLFQKPFSTVLFLFHVIGVDIDYCSKHTNRNKLSRCIFKCPKYIFNFILFSVLFIQLNWLIVLREKRTEAALFVILLIQSTAHISVYIRRKYIALGLRNLSRISELLPFKGNFQRLNVLVHIYCFCFACLVIGLMSWHFPSGENAVYFEQCCQSHVLSDIFEDPSTYCKFIQNVMLFCFPLVLGGTLITFTSYYSLMCVHIHLFYGQLISQLQNSQAVLDCHRMLQAYEAISNTVTSLDDRFSYAAFITVLSSMAGIFRASYVLIFDRKATTMTLIYYCVALMLYLYVFLSIILSASAATQKGRVSKELIVSLPGKYPSHYKKLKMILRNNFKSDVALTLWKMYVIERSILISACGTLVTYGILIATLGNVQVS